MTERAERSQLEIQLKNHLLAGRFEEAIRLADELAEHLQQSEGVDRSELGLCLATAAEARRRAGRLVDSEAQYRRALEMFREEFGVCHPLIARALERLGEIRRELEDQAAARALEWEAEVVATLARLRAETSVDPMDLAMATNNVALAAHLDGRREQAESLYVEAVRILKEAGLDRTPDFAGVLMNHAEMLREAGHGGALQLHRQALALRSELLEEDDERVIVSLQNLAAACFELGEPEEALVHYERSIEVLRRSPGSNAAALSESLVALAVVLVELGELAQAVEVAKEGLSILDTGDPEWQREIAGILRFFVGETLKRNHADLADEVCSAVLDSWREALGVRHPLLTIVAQGRASVEALRGNADVAKRILRESLGEVDATGSTLLVGPLTQLAAYHAGVDEQREAGSLLSRAFEICRRTEGQWCAKSLRLCGSAAAYARLGGDIETARVLGQQAVRLAERIAGPKSAELADSLDNLAELCRTTGDYQEAVDLAWRGLEVRQAVLGEDHPGLAHSLNNLGNLLHELGDDDFGPFLMARAFELTRRSSEPRLIGGLLNNLGNAALAAREPEVARELFRQALKVMPQGSAAERSRAALIHGNLAVVAHKLGEGQQTEEQLEAAVAMMTDKQESKARMMMNLAVLKLLGGDFERAEALLQTGIDLARKWSGENLDLVAGMNDLAILRVRQGKPELALATLLEAGEIEDRLFDEVLSGVSERQRYQFLESIKENLVFVASLIITTFGEARGKAEVLMNRVLRRKGVGLQVLLGQREVLSESSDPSIRGRQEELDDVIHEISELDAALTRGAKEKERSSLEARRSAASERRERLEAQVIATIRPTPLDEYPGWKALAAALQDETCLVEMVALPLVDMSSNAGETEEHYLAFVVVPAEKSGLRLLDLGTKKRVDELVAAFRAEVTGERDLELVRVDIAEKPKVRRRQIGEELRRMVFDPIAECFGERRRCLLAPDGNLNQLPFAALPLDSDRYVIDEYEVSYLDVSRSLLGWERQPGAAPPAAPAVFAAPAFNLEIPADERTAFPKGGRWSDLSSRLSPFSHLPGTELEGRRIATMLGVEPSLGAEVTEARVRASRAPVILHLATHGFFLALEVPADHSPPRTPHVMNPQPFFSLDGLRQRGALARSGLALSGANTWLDGGALPEEAGDGLLTAEDVATLELVGTRLVVLSACETGLGEVMPGEGVFGLQRAFTLAGVKTLVMSLWKISDPDTCRLMERFYEGLLAGEGCSEALHIAQLELRAEYPENPELWGGFICQGDPSPLSDKERSAVCG